MRLTGAATLVAMTLTLVLAAAASSAPKGPSFGSFPKQLAAGKRITVAVTLPAARDMCALKVTYAGGVAQRGLVSRFVMGRHVAWSWLVPKTTRAGAAKLAVSCTSAGRAARSFRVAPPQAPAPAVAPATGGTTTTPAPTPAAPKPNELKPTIDVVKEGFSIRSKSGRDTVSFGVLLVNRSETADATNVSVLVNMVAANDKLVGSKSTKIDTIPAGSEYRHGSSLSFPGTSAVARLEVVVLVGGRQPAVKAPVPTVSNPSFQAERSDPTFVDQVFAELANGSNRVIKRAKISAIVLDGAGNVIGGGTGSMSAPTAPGARQLFKITSGVDSIALKDAASVEFTVAPDFE